MATSHLRRLNLSLDQARSVTDYHQSYANTTGRDLESNRGKPESVGKMPTARNGRTRNGSSR